MKKNEKIFKMIAASLLLLALTVQGMTSCGKTDAQIETAPDMNTENMADDDNGDDKADEAGQTEKPAETDKPKTEPYETDVMELKLEVGDNTEFNGKKWQVTFVDNFDGSSLDDTKWSLCPNWERSDLGAYWMNSMTNVNGGNLILSVAKKDKLLMSGAIRSRDKFSQAYGYYETRCTLPQAPGFWSAFWLMYTDGPVGNEGKDGTEIDIFESPYIKTDRINHALHWDGYGEDHKSEGQSVKVEDIYDGKYHTFGLDWSKDEYIFYIDGTETWRSAAGGICEVPLYLKLTTEVGSWAGFTKNDLLPTSVYFDYVVVYKESE